MAIKNVILYNYFTDEYHTCTIQADLDLCYSHICNKSFSPYVSHTTVHYNFESIKFELPHDKTNKKVACVPSEDLDQPYAESDPSFQRPMVSSGTQPKLK